MKDSSSCVVHEYYRFATLCAGPVGSGYLEVQLDAVVSYNQAAGEMLILEKGQFTMPPIPWLWKAKTSDKYTNQSGCRYFICLAFQSRVFCVYQWSKVQECEWTSIQVTSL